MGELATGMPIFHTRHLIQAPAIPLLIQALANVPREAADNDSGAWTLPPTLGTSATHMGDTDRVPALGISQAQSWLLRAFRK